MPTPRYHGGAPLTNIPLTVPGFRGLNKQNESSLLGPEWATHLENAVFDESGRLGARKGWNLLTSDAADIGAEIVSLFEFVKRNGSTELLATTNTAIFRSTDGGASWTDVTGTASFSDGDWHFVNFNDKVLAFQQGKVPLIYEGGTFAPHDVPGIPLGGVALSAFGRLWVVDSDRTTVKYCALLNEDDWETVDNAGQLGMLNIWPKADTVKGLAAFNGALVVFGKWNILFFTDGRGSAIGLDPLTAYIADTMTGTGCVSQKTIQNVDGDLWFLAPQGLMSLTRLINERSNPLQNLSLNVQDYLRGLVNSSPLSYIRGTYYPRERFYILSMPTDTGGIAVVFDTRGLMEGGVARCAGTWSGLVPRAAVATQDEKLIMALIGKTGEVGQYGGRLDDGEAYTMDYESGWLDLDNGTYLKILKNLNGTFYADRIATVQFKWAFDFSPVFTTKDYTFSAASTDSNAEWGVSEWGLAEFSGGVSLRKARSTATGTGEYVKVGVTIEINNLELAIQELELFAKIGRLAT